MTDNKISKGFNMNSLFRTKTIAYCVAVALAQMSAVGVAHADSAVGQNTTLGNAGHSAPVNPDAEQAGGLDPEGMGTRDTVSHSPSGLPYNIPNADTELVGDGKTTTFNGTVEAGVVGVGGDSNAQYFKTYQDVKTGPAVQSFSFQAEKPADATFLEATGGGVGRDDQFYGVQFGKYNDWKIKGFYNEIPHVFTTTAKNIWNGTGTNNLTLQGGLAGSSGVSYIGANSVAAAAGAAVNGTSVLCSNPVGGAALAVGAPCFISTNAYSPAGTPTYGAAGAVVNPILQNVPFSANAYAGAATNLTNGGVNSLQTRQLMALSASQPYTQLSLIRKQDGISLEKDLTDSWKFFTTASMEKRQGARPIGLTMSSFSDTMIIPEPIDYTTKDFKAGLRFKDKLTQFNVVVSANLFNNANNEVMVQNPWSTGATASAALINSVPLSLPPNNQAYGITADLARNFPDFFNGRFNGTVSWNTSRQNDQLLPWTNTTGIGTVPAAGAASVGAFNGNFNQWDQSPGNANARIDTKLVDLKFAMQPKDDLSVAAKMRFFETDNQTKFAMCNPNATYADGTQYTGTINGQTCTGAWGYIGGSSQPKLLNPQGVTSGPIPTNTGAVLTAGVITANAFNNGNTATSAYVNGLLPASANVWMGNVPWDRREYTPTLTADYTLNRFSSLNGSFERETIDRSNRERDQTWEDKLKLGYTNRALGNGTLRVSFEDDSRRGSAYNPSPYITTFGGMAFSAAPQGPTGSCVGGQLGTTTLQNGINVVTSGCGSSAANALGSALLGYSIANADLRKSDLADRDQNIFNARYNLALREGLDLGSSLQWKTVNYPNSLLGRQNQDQHSLGLDLNYSALAGQVWYASFSYQDTNFQQGNQQNGALQTCNVGRVGPNGTVETVANAVSYCDSSSAGVIWNPANMESMDTKDTFQMLALGLKKEIGNKTLDVNYSHSNSVSKTSYTFGPNNTTFYPVGNNGSVAALAGSSFPDTTFSTDTLTASLRVPVDKQMALRFTGSYQVGRVTDWHYTGLGNNMVTGNENNPLFLDAGPQNYSVTTASVLLQYKL